jgi:hypothetical protein
MLKLADRVKQSSITVGDGDIVLYDTYLGFTSFASAIGDGNTTYYTIENNGNYEIGIGTYKSDGNILTRDVVLKSSNNGSKILLDGVSIVFCTYPADFAYFLNTDGYASGQSPIYKGVVFPNGTIQYTAINGSGIANHIPYWEDSTTLSSNNGLTFDNSTYTLGVSGVAVFNSDVTVKGDFTVFGTQTVVNTEISNTQIEQSTLVDTIFYRTTAGCFFHAYVDNNYDNIISLYSTNEIDTHWKLGLKTYSPSFIGPPIFGYIEGSNGHAGIYATSQNYAKINFTNGFWVNHRNIDVFNASKTNGASIYNQTSTVPALIVRAAAGQSANIQEWETYASSLVASIDINGQFSCSSIRFNQDNSIQTKAYTENYRNISSSTNLLISDDVVFIDTTLSDVNITLPNATNNGGKKIVIKRKSGNNNLIILPISPEKLDNAISFALNYNNQSITVVSDNSDWYII